MKNIIYAVVPWFSVVVKPKNTFNTLIKKENYLNIAFISVLIYAFLYSITAYILYISGRLIKLDPWMPINKEKYYFYQTFFTIPWGVFTWILLSGTAHLIAIIGKKDRNKYRFEKAAVICAISWITPSVYCTWIPETIFAPTDVVFPFWFETIRLMILLPLGQIVLTMIGMKVTHNTNWIVGSIIGIITTGLSFIMFLAFIR